MPQTFESLRQLEHHIDDTIRLYPNREADDYPAHWHAALEMIMPVENVYTVVVSEETYQIHPEEILIIPTGVVHEIFAPEAGARYLFLIDQEEVYAIEGMTKYQHVLYPCVHLRGDVDSECLQTAREYFYRAVNEYRGDAPLGSAAARQWLRLLLTLTVRHRLAGETAESETVSRKQMSVSAILMDVCAYISEHSAEKLTLDDMANYTGYSKYHFARIFKLHVGMNFYDYYLQQRMVTCRRLLSDPAMPITDVAMASGFGSIATFNRVFRQQEGVTPTEYRKMQQQAPEVRQK